MLPEEDTIDAMFETVKAFCQRKGEKKNFWANFKIDLTSPRNMLSILAPGLLFLVAWGLVIINPLVGNLLILNLISLSLVLLMYISLFLGWTIGIWKDMRNTLGATIDSASEFAKRDLQRVKDFYEYEPDALKYMLVQIKAKRAAWEKHIGLLTGTLEKIGFIPTIIALLAILIRPEIGQFSKVWVQNIAIGVFSLYFGSFVVNHLMTKLDRA